MNLRLPFTKTDSLPDVNSANQFGHSTSFASNKQGFKNLHVGIVHNRPYIIAIACKENVARGMTEKLCLPLQASKQETSLDFE